MDTTSKCNTCDEKEVSGYTLLIPQANQSEQTTSQPNNIEDYYQRVKGGNYTGGRESIIKAIDKRVEFYTNSIAEFNENAVSQENADNKISALIQEQFPVNWYEGSEKIYNVIALCRIAKEVQSVTPIYQISDSLDLCIYSPGERFFSPLRKINYTLEDFPLMDLAMSLGERSIPALSRIVLDREKDFSNRLFAYSLCHQINANTAKGLFTIIDEDITASQKTAMEKIIRADNPIEAWEVYYSEHNLNEKRSKKE